MSSRSRRRTRGGVSDPGGKARRFSATTRLVLVLTACAIAFILTRRAVVGDPTLLDGPPAELLGVWQTDDPRYQGRGFEILLDGFLLQVGPDDVRAYPLRSVRAEATEGGTRYEVSYLTPDGESTHRFTIDSLGTGRLDRPSDVIWTRTAG